MGVSIMLVVPFALFPPVCADSLHIQTHTISLPEIVMEDTPPLPSPPQQSVAYN